jgi:branched-chain amino acid transport system substrate-binding protein
MASRSYSEYIVAMRLTVLIHSVILLSLATIAYATPQCPHPALRVGAVVPLSAGPVSVGTSIMNGIILADEIHDLNKCVEFIFEDDQFAPKNTVLAVRKLVERDHVQGLIISTSPTALAVNDIAEQYKVPMIALSILQKVVGNRKFVMDHFITVEEETRLVIDEFRRRKYKNVAVVSTLNDAMLTLRDNFISAVSPTPILSNEEFKKDDFDFRTTSAKIAKLNPDSVYILLYPPQTGLFVKELRASGFKNPIFGAHNIEDPHEVEVAHGAMTGMWYVNGDESGFDFHPTYKKRFGSDASLGGANGYDIAKLFIEASSAEDINQYLHTVKNFRGAFGIYDASGKGNFFIPGVIREVTPNDFVTLTR